MSFLHVVYWLYGLNDEPLDSEVYHVPASFQRAATSALPSPLKSPTSTSTQSTTPGVCLDQVVHTESVNVFAVGVVR